MWNDSSRRAIRVIFAGRSLVFTGLRLLALVALFGIGGCDSSPTPYPGQQGKTPSVDRGDPGAGFDPGAGESGGGEADAPPFAGADDTVAGDGGTGGETAPEPEAGADASDGAGDASDAEVGPTEDAGGDAESDGGPEEDGDGGDEGGHEAHHGGDA